MHPNSLANLQKGKRFDGRDDSARKAQEKSAAVQRGRLSFKDGFLRLLNDNLRDKDGNVTEKTTQDAVIAGIVKRACAGDVRAAEFIRDTIGEKPKEVVEVIKPKTDLADEIEAMLRGGS